MGALRSHQWNIMSGKVGRRTATRMIAALGERAHDMAAEEARAAEDGETSVSVGIASFRALGLGSRWKHIDLLRTGE